jgi:hypothetical protein
MSRVIVVALGLVALMTFSVPAAYGTYYGPSITVPVSIALGSNITIDLSTVAASYFVAPPGIHANSPCSAGYCPYPLQSCINPAAFYVAIHKVAVIDPNGNIYSLGSSKGTGLYFPANQGGGMPNNGSPAKIADELNITIGQSDTLVFGAGATGPSGATFASDDYRTSAPFTAIPHLAGPYYWWTVRGNTYGPNLRLDQNPLLNPTIIAGTYQVDVEGVAVCGQNTTTVHNILFFDAAVVITTPEFNISAVAVTGMAFLVLMLARRTSFGRKPKLY